MDGTEVNFQYTSGIKVCFNLSAEHTGFIWLECKATPFLHLYLTWKNSEE